MIYTKLSLINIGAYLGLYELEFSPVDASRNITLIGGKNGAGKTTLLEALRICLYGPYAFGYRTESDLYTQKIQSLLNTIAIDQKEDLYQIDLEFKYTENFSLDYFRLTRSWSLSNNNFKEYFNVSKNGQNLSEHEKELFLVKIREEIPPKLFEFCLFDGEEISRIILDDTLPQYIGEIAKVLFNLDLFENLESDLTQLFRQSSYSLKPSDQEKLEATIVTLQTLEEKKRSILDCQVKLATDRDNFRYELEQLKKDYAINGGLVKDERDKLLVKIQDFENKRHHNDERIKKFTSELLPFLLANKVLKDTKVQMAKEVNYEAFSNISSTLQDSDFKPLIDSLSLTELLSSEKFENELSKFLLNLFQSDNGTIIHKSSAKQRGEIEKLNLEIEEIKISDLLNLFKLNNTYLKKIQTARKQIALHDSTHELEQYMIKIEHLYKQIALYESEHRNKETELSELEKKIVKTSRELDVLNSKLHNLYKNETAFDIGNKVLAVSKKFRQMQLKKKLQQVEIETAQFIQVLFRKEQFLDNVLINPETFELELLDSNSAIVNKQKLSAGEKEILLLAIIWAMVKCSGRKLPFVFDTLLGRLDKTHRETIVTTLLPKISEQVILLTTDSEIDYELYAQISRHLARTYTLEYMNDKKRICIGNGFFAINITEAVS